MIYNCRLTIGRVELTDTPAEEVLHSLNYAVQDIAKSPAWRASQLVGPPQSWPNCELSLTEELILAELARSILECERNATRIERLFSATDPTVLAKFVQQVDVWLYVLHDMRGPLPWPKHPEDILPYIVKIRLQIGPRDATPNRPPKIDL